MKIALLLCDEFRSELLDEFVGYGDMFSDLINQGDELIIFPVYLSQSNECSEGVFPSIEQFDGFIVSGSRAGVYEDHVWMAPLLDSIRRIVAMNKKLLGVCFGHQAIAYAMGGGVSKSEKGWGIGNYENQWIKSPSNAMFFEKNKLENNQPLNLLSFHQDQVDALPDGFEVCAKSDFTPYFVTKLKKQVLTTQGHPEMSPQYISALTYMEEGKIGEPIASAARRSLLEVDDTAAFRCLIKDFWVS